MSACKEHLVEMQELASRYLEPGPYTSRRGHTWYTPEGINEAFAEDMFNMLDGPEQRSAFADEER